MPLIKERSWCPQSSVIATDWVALRANWLGTAHPRKNDKTPGFDAGGSLLPPCGDQRLRSQSSTSRSASSRAWP
jgi:hypothetical protein